MDETMVLENIQKHSSDVNELFNAMLNNIKNGHSFKDGVSFLDVRNESLVSYMIEVCNIILAKLYSKTLVDFPSIDRAVDIRVTLDKMKIIHQRLSYQLDKLLNTSGTPAYRVNLENIVVDDGDEEEEEKGKEVNEEEVHSDEEVEQADESDAQDSNVSGGGGSGYDSEDSEVLLKAKNKQLQKEQGIYKPPKLRSMAYDSDDADDAKSKKRKRKAALNKVVMDDIRRELDDMPLEIHDRTEKEDKNVKRYEEENFTRLAAPSSKRKSRTLSKKKKSKKFKKR